MSHPLQMDLPMSETATASPDLPVQSQQQKRSRSDLPSAPSPASVMNEHMMIAEPSPDLVTPVAKRRRQESPEWCRDDAQAAAAHGKVTPEEHRPPVATEAMERDEQYAWWKKPPAAPQLLESTTMLHASSSSDSATGEQPNVLGCNSCQRLFVPPKLTPSSGSTTTQQATLHNYFFTNNKPPPTAAPASNAAEIDVASCRCTFCERATCGNCLRECEQCEHRFCILCSTRAYMPHNPRQEQTLCLDCASMLDIPQSGDAMIEG